MEKEGKKEKMRGSGQQLPSGGRTRGRRRRNCSPRRRKWRKERKNTDKEVMV